MSQHRIHTLLRWALAFASAIVASMSTLFDSRSVAYAAPILTITPITWNVIGLDSNSPATGPSAFPVGVRVCNTGDAAATNLVSNFVWDSTNAYINVDGLSSLTEPTLAPSACVDFYFQVVVQKVAASFDTARRYHITVTGDGLGSISTPQPREIGTCQ